MEQTDSCQTGVGGRGGREIGRKKVKGLAKEHTCGNDSWTQTTVWRWPEGRRETGVSAIVSAIKIKKNSIDNYVLQKRNLGQRKDVERVKLQKIDKYEEIVFTCMFSCKQFHEVLHVIQYYTIENEIQMSYVITLFLS